jgi:hypothetical protein
VIWQYSRPTGAQGGFRRFLGAGEVLMQVLLDGAHELLVVVPEPDYLGSCCAYYFVRVIVDKAKVSTYFEQRRYLLSGTRLA